MPSRRPAGPPARARRGSPRVGDRTVPPVEVGHLHARRPFDRGRRAHRRPAARAAAGRRPGRRVRAALEPRLLAEAGSGPPRGAVDPRDGARRARGGSTEARRDGAPLRRGPGPRGRPGTWRAGIHTRLRGVSSARRDGRRRSRPGSRHGAASSAGEPAGRHPRAEPVDRPYETYVVERRDGGTAAGLLGAETPTTITLRQGGERDLVVRRDEIEKIAVSPQSTMPPDLDAAISPEEMADLLAFIRR